jgi:prepilin-type N-terminal cleavage/methylation domain-containing protein
MGVDGMSTGNSRLKISFRPRLAGSDQGGFTLIEVAIVLAIVSLLMGMGIQAFSRSLDNAKIKTTNERMDQIESAIVQFAIQNSYLPCPANGALPNTDGNYGLSLTTSGVSGASACDITFAAGARVIPWRTLGLDELYSRDGWGNRISYAVSGLDPTGTNSIVISANFARTTTAPYYPYGNLIINNVAGTQLTNSSSGAPGGCTATANICAAYVLISHGAHAVGAYRGDGITTITVAGTSHAGETANNDGATPFVQNAIIEQAVTGTPFDDIVRWRSAQSIVSACGTGACGNP